MISNVISIVMKRMDIKEKIARIWRDGGSSWNINKKVEKTLALPELDEHYRAKGWKSPSDIQKMIDMVKLVMEAQ